MINIDLFETIFPEPSRYPEWCLFGRFKEVAKAFWRLEAFPEDVNEAYEVIKNESI
jgi:hypothetical protein